MRAPGPATGILRGRRLAVLVEAREIHPPDIAIARRQGALVGMREPAHASPRKRQLDPPAAVAVGVVVERSIDMHRRLEAGEVPIPEPDPWPARMIGEPHTIERPHLGMVALKLWDLVISAALVSFLPDKEHFVNRAQRVDLKLIIGVL